MKFPKERSGLVLGRKPNQRIMIGQDYILTYLGESRMGQQKGLISITGADFRITKELDPEGSYQVAPNIIVTYLGRDRWNNGKIHIAAPRHITIKREEISG